MCSKIRRKNKERKAGAACRDKLNKRESVGVDQAQEGAGGGGGGEEGRWGCSSGRSWMCPPLVRSQAQGLTAQQRWQAAWRGIESRPSQHFPNERGLGGSHGHPLNPLWPGPSPRSTWQGDSWRVDVAFPGPRPWAGWPGREACTEMSRTQKSILSVFP